jgi:ATP-dependent RNA helicase DDX35
MSGFSSSNFIKPSSSFGEREASSTGEQSGSVVVPRLPLNATLPVHEHRDRILYALEKYPVLIMVGETGCGKSTQIPQMLYRAGWTEKEQCIVCTQPRRLAALSLSKRVSEEMCTNLGEKVGYSVRFEDNFNKRGVRTAIKYATEATLIRETLHDPLLSGYSVVMVDEAHERSLQGDVLLGLLKKILRHRKSDFRVIVASATLDTAALRDFFEPVVGSSNRKFQQVCVLQVGAATGDGSGGRQMHPVDLAYLKRPCANFVVETVDTVLSLHSREQQQQQGGAERGDILCFLPGHEDVELAARMLTERLDEDSSSSSSSDTSRSIVVVPLHEHLPTSVQMRVFQPTASAAVRKVILATSIAETAITVPGVRYVVDSGYTQYRYFDVRSGVETLTTCLASKAVAVQRSGRAGRTMPGRCFRLMTEEFYRTSPDIPLLPTAEMQRVDVTWAVLQLKAIGIDDILHFDFLSPPSPASLIHALDLLYSLGTLDRECRLTTATGARMAELPLNPKLSKCLLASLEEGCAVEILAIAAMASVPFPFLSPAQLNGIRHSYQQRGSDGSSRSQQHQQQQHDAQPTKAELRRYLQTCITAFVYPHSSHRAKEGHGQSDHLTLLAVYNAFAENGCNRQWCERHCLQFEVMQQAHAVRTNLYRLVRQYEIASDGAYVIASCSNDSDSHDTVLKCLVAGLFANAAKLGTDGRYHTLKGGVPCRLHPTSCLLFPPPSGKRGGASGPSLQHLPEWIVYSEVTSTTLPGSSTSSSSSYGGYDFQHEREVAVLREASRIHPRWLADLASHYYKLYENEQQP